VFTQEVTAKGMNGADARLFEFLDCFSEILLSSLCVLLSRIFDCRTQTQLQLTSGKLCESNSNNIAEIHTSVDDSRQNPSDKRGCFSRSCRSFNNERRVEVVTYALSRFAICYVRVGHGKFSKLIWTRRSRGFNLTRLSSKLPHTARKSHHLHESFRRSRQKAINQTLSNVAQNRTEYVPVLFVELNDPFLVTAIRRQ
jgi:hypothetical protein